MQKPTGHTHSVLWHVSVYWVTPKSRSTSMHVQLRQLVRTLIMTRYLDVPNLISWLCERQQAPLGGLAGRSNKLVDGCYSHWIGGCFALVEAAIRDHFTGNIWDRDALTRYILCCAQSERGGLRDKPGM